MNPCCLLTNIVMLEKSYWIEGKLKCEFNKQFTDMCLFSVLLNAVNISNDSFQSMINLLLIRDATVFKSNLSCIRF